MQAPSLSPTSRSHTIRWLSVAALSPDPRNPRRHSDRQIKQIQRSIQSFGFNVPILVDGHDRVLAGHGRLLAAQRLGYTQVPVIALEHLTRAQAQAFAIADNRLTEQASWDEALLGEIFAELSSLDLDFSLEDTGFTIGEIDLQIEANQAKALSSSPSSAESPTRTDPADDLPAPSAEPPVSRLGDLWELGAHRVQCANALEADSYADLLGAERAHVVFTDPPYNVRIHGHASGNGQVRHREFAMASGEMSPEAFQAFLATAFGHLATHSHPGSIHYVCMDWRHLADALAAGSEAYSTLKNLCVWVKDKGGMGSLYRSQHEMVLVFKHGSASHRNNVQLGQFGRNRTNVWHYPGALALSRGPEAENLLALHPTVKPVALVADALMDCSARGDLVLDSFLGSGSTLLAAERVGRVCRGLELDPVYVDTAIRRWQTYTGEAARHADTGRSFEEMQRMRQARTTRRERKVLHG